MLDDDSQLVRPDGLSVRRRRHDHDWSLRDLVVAIEEASIAATGVRDTLTPNQLTGIEERGERVAYSVLSLVAAGLDCDPVDILASDQQMQEGYASQHAPTDDLAPADHDGLD
jgi:hypothetical protein